MGIKAATLPHLFFEQVNTQRNRIALRRKEDFKPATGWRFSEIIDPNGSCVTWRPWLPVV